MSLWTEHSNGRLTALADEIDLGHLQRYTMGEPALTEELLRMFCNEVRAFDLNMNADARTQQRALHRLKGSARAVGAFPLAAAAERLERLLAVDARGAGLAAARADLGRRLQALRDACEAWKAMMKYRT